MTPGVGASRAPPQPRVQQSTWFLSATERLIGVVQELSLVRDLPALQRIVRKSARELTGADGATFVLREGDLCFYADEDAIAPLWKGRRFPMESCISGWVMRNRAPAVIEDIYTDARIPAEAYRPTFVRSLAMVPIRTRDPVGAIGNYWALKHRPTESELDVLQALADSTAVSLELVRVLSDLEEHVRRRTRDLEAANAEIRQLSLIDELTGLHNRRGFFVLAEQVRKAATRQRARAFLLFVDADGLKKVNDSLGHEAGDEMLRRLAQVLKTTFRKSDVLARVGGDEFCVFGIHDDGDPNQVKDRLDQSLAAFNAHHGGPYQLAASVGLYCFSADDACALEEVVAQADKAMYAEKKARHGAGK